MQENHIEIEALDLLAFRYIAGEMTAAEADSFEQRLADDQTAREAVACAVDLSHAIARVPADVIPLATTHHSPLTTHSVSPRRWQRSARWIAAAAAVALGVFGFQYFKGSSEQSRLAKVWANLWLGSDAVAVPDHDLIADTKESITDDEDELTVPGWMIEAVGGSDPDKWEDS
jgi:hypothetical protein